MRIRRKTTETYSHEFGFELALKISFEIFWPLKNSKPGDVSNEKEVSNTLEPPKENEKKYTSTPKNYTKGYSFLKTSVISNYSTILSKCTYPNKRT